eukprot:365912-Chlamydomonas_euryale.AAC.1
MVRTRAILSAVPSARMQRSAVYIAPYDELKRSAAAEVACMGSRGMAALLRAGKPKSSGAPLHALLWVTADSLGLHALVMQWQALHDMTTICLISPSSLC